MKRAERRGRMESDKERIIPLERLLKHPLSKEFLDSGYDKPILQYQISDPMLKSISYDEIYEKGLRFFLKTLLERGSEWESLREEESQKFQEVFGVGKQIEEEDNRITLLVNEDYTESKIILHKPYKGQENLSENQIWKMLLKRGITYGVKKEFIIRLAEKPVYEKTFKMALGKRPSKGKDGNAIFYFKTEFNPAPKRNEDGTVDYKELEYVQNVKKGELLCELIPPEKGEDGITLDGKTAEGLYGDNACVEPGNNTVISPDGAKIYAACDGSPHFHKGKVEVRKTLMLKTVDTSTGNIEFAGNIRIDGDVEGAFMVKATGDIIVDGIVDGKLYAGGNILLKKGVKGGGKSYLESDKDIRAEFLENAFVLCKGSISADSVLNSEITCWNNLSVIGRNGKIIGGKIAVGGRVIADEIGNEANTSTSLILEMADGEFQHNREIEEKIKASGHMIKQVRLILEHEENISDTNQQIVVLRLVYVVLQLETEILHWKKELEEVRKKNSVKRSVSVKEVLYPNVFVRIEGMFFRNASKKVGRTTVRIVKGRMTTVNDREEQKDYEKHF